MRQRVETCRCGNMSANITAGLPPKSPKLLSLGFGAYGLRIRVQDSGFRGLGVMRSDRSSRVCKDRGTTFGKRRAPYWLEMTWERQARQESRRNRHERQERQTGTAASQRLSSSLLDGCEHAVGPTWVAYEFGPPPHTCTAPHRTAPHRTAPTRTDPHRTAAHRIAPRHHTTKWRGATNATRAWGCSGARRCPCAGTPCD